MLFRKGLLGVLGLVLTGGLVSFAQQAQTQTPTAKTEGTFQRDRTERRERRRERMARRQGRARHDRLGRHGLGGRMGRFMRELNLSDEQRRQGDAIMQRRLESTKAQREELLKLREKRSGGTLSAEDEARAKTLHQDIRATMEGARTEMAAVLTAEQKTRLEELQRERKAKTEQRMRERQQRLNKIPR